MVEVNKHLAVQVWQALDAGSTPYAIGEAGTPSTRTAQRLKAAMKGFQAALSLDRISRATGWRTERVEMVHNWWREWQSTLVAPTTPVAIAVHGGQLSATMQRHFASLLGVGEKLREDLESLSQEYQPVRYDSQVVQQPRVTFRAEAWQDGVRLFARFRSHVDTPRLWSAFDSLKDALAQHVERVFAKRDEMSVSNQQWPNPDYRGLRVDVPNSYRGVFQGKIGLDFDSLPQSYDVLVEELDKVLHIGIESGQCDLCAPG